VAEKRRRFNDADWRLREAAWVIAAEPDDNAVMLGFLAAREAHYHFYHHEYHSYTDQLIIDSVEVMVARACRQIEGGSCRTSHFVVPAKAGTSTGWSRSARGGCRRRNDGEFDDTP
jgi:hypothetical protein